jgi:transcriptional regulator with XRE-family HTH domain
MKDDINQRIARRLGELRAGLGLSLTGLSVKSGVSRSMISLIERGETSPTAAVLEKLSAGLDTTLAGLFAAPAATAPSEPAGPVARCADQAEWRDPASGYRRRNLTPAGLEVPLQLVEVRFPARARVSFDNHGRDTRIHQQVWIIAGTMELTIGDDVHRLETGDCLAMQLDRPLMFHNPTDKPARYLVGLVHERRKAG